MAWEQHTLQIIRRLRTVHQEISADYVERDLVVELLQLAAVTREHLLLLGPPGTAKTDLVERFCLGLGARRYRYLLTRFTEPSEIFGPLDFARFQQGEYHIQTSGMLPEAEIAFLDEVFQGSSAILNTLLTLLNERRFHNGPHTQHAPLISVFGASAELPEDPALSAFADRFLIRARVEPVGESHLPDLLEAGWGRERDRLSSRNGAAPTPLVDTAELAQLTGRLGRVDLDVIRPLYEELIRELRGQGVALSDRRLVRGLKLVAGAALLSERDVAAAEDLWPIAHAWADPADADLVADIVAERSSSGEAARERSRPTSEIVAEARFEAERVSAPSYDVTRGSIDATLRTLSRLRRELLTGPQDPPRRAGTDEVDQLIDYVMSHYQNIS
ncbi:MoxR-like ATPase [Sinosporangium album]|uniref:MoxR-like ATPase n=1 Tax=Sinosporangium album TaxID=504805 RepID=A0A1G7X484_9ACTN|nr:AAA family ATPase [Sinosporangium album]SDG78975.1 MoxR-like ATPase [Sinosporangium album]